MPGDDTPSSRADRASLAERVAARTALKGLLHPTAPEEPAAPANRGAAPVPPPPAAAPDHAPDTAPKPEPAPATGGGEPAAPHLKINFTRLQAVGFATPNTPRASLVEEFRVIKRQLLKDAFPEEKRDLSNVVMVTSSLPDEGKTFVTLNLALSLTTERDLHVLLIDGDCHQHSLSNLLGAERENGLIDMLAHPDLAVRDVLRRTDIPNLSFLPSGSVHPNSAELMASKQAGALIADFSRRYPDRIILIDTPPVLANTEAAILSAYVGETVVVVEKHRTSKRSLRRAIEMLENCANVSCVLNMTSPRNTYSNYAKFGY